LSSGWNLELGTWNQEGAAAGRVRREEGGLDYPVMAAPDVAFGDWSGASESLRPCCIGKGSRSRLRLARGGDDCYWPRSWNDMTGQAAKSQEIA
jgi:hypothetical protein